MTAPSLEAPIRVVIVDDNPQFRNVLHRLLDREADITVVAEAATGGQALAHAQELQPDLVLMDVSMPELDGISATTRMKEMDPLLPVVLLSVGSKSQEITAGLESGASEYLVKGAPAATIIATVRRHARRTPQS